MLNLKKISKHTKRHLDFDYLDSLDESELQWLTQFSEAYYCCGGEMINEVSAVSEFTTTGYNRGLPSHTVTGRQALNKAHWSRRMDALSRSISVSSESFVEAAKPLTRGTC